MSIDVRLPQLTDSMIAAKVAGWLKKEGDFVIEGEPLVEVETDKASVEIVAPASGVLGCINVPAGTENVVVGVVLANIRQDIEHSEALEPSGQAVVSAHVPDTRERPAMDELHESGTSVRVTATNSPERINVTPLARRMAAIAQIAIDEIALESGQKIRKADVERELWRRNGPRQPRAVPNASTAPSAAAEPVIGSLSGPFEDKPVSAMRRVTARRMLESTQTIPHFYLQSTCNADALLELRNRLNPRRGDDKLTLTDFIVRAAALALQRVPDAGASWLERGVRVFDHADIAVAVATPDGLITPVVRDAGSKGLGAISREIKMLSARARAGRLQPAEYSGGTLTVSNLGMYGVTSIYPIINPPQSCILGIGAIEQRALVTNGQLGVGAAFTCTLAADHRALDGAIGARFLAEFRSYVEEPLSMVMES